WCIHYRYGMHGEKDNQPKYKYTHPSVLDTWFRVMLASAQSAFYCGSSRIHMEPVRQGISHPVNLLI
ncbi:MAG: hypothetical protein KDJ22_17430, partial [Candidatus Competibacteraceae bacterium]|nr:hypothetical protein [Candidatus Competibacteraceae bacterium]